MDIFNPHKILVGKTIGDIYYSHRNKHHVMKMFQGLGISESVLLQIEKLGIKKIVLIYHRVDGEIEEHKYTLEEYLYSPDYKRIDTKINPEIEDMQHFMKLRPTKK